MLHRIGKYISQNRLLEKDRLQLVALSGGADSVALLHVLLNLGYHVEAMHCNFHLRGEESNRDERFCQKLCERLGVKLHVAHFDTHAYAQLHHVSIEMAARELRYSYFRQLRHDLQADAICVAHHRDDQAETVLLNIIRGTGIAGLGGMKARNGDIARPMLCVTRHEIEDYLTLIGQPYVTDSTNLVADVTRNKLRLEVLPLLRQINPNITEALNSTAQHCQEAALMVQEGCFRHAKAALSQPGSYALSAIMHSPSPQQLLFHIFSENGISPSLVSQVYDVITYQTDNTGRQWQSNGMTVLLDRGNLIIEKQHEAFPEMRIPICGNYVVDNHGRLSVAESMHTPDFHIDPDPMLAVMDAGKVVFPLIVREVRPADRFRPLGMRGTKLVSDFLTDRKLSLLEKQRQLCIADATGTILWLVGQRLSDCCKVTSDTIKLLSLRYIENSNS